MSKEKLTDNSIMPWGKYKGHNMINVPANYLLYLYENDKCHGAVKDYIIENLEFIKKGC
jgi:uncharacterized protein (DUF3820 family)